MIPVVVGLVIIERRRGHPWLMRGQFGIAWEEIHGPDSNVPDEAFDAWLAEWYPTRVSARAWLDRDGSVPI